MPKVFIQDSALLSIIIASVEVFRKETYGILLGKKQGKNYFVKHAISFQTATHDYEFVAIDKSSENRLANIAKYLTKQKYLGDFHSHAGRFEELSRYDKKDILMQGPNKVFFLIVIRRPKRAFKWAYNSREKSVSGSLGKRFFVKIFAFQVNKKTKKIEKLIIRANLLKKFNSFAKQVEKIEKKIAKIEKQSKKHKKTKKKLKKKLSF